MHECMADNKERNNVFQQARTDTSVLIGKQSSSRKNRFVAQKTVCKVTVQSW